MDLAVLILNGRRLLFAGALLLSGTSLAPAQDKSGPGNGSLVVPAEVVLYIQSDLKSTDFVQPLVCALQRVLTAPVSTQSLDLPLGREFQATPTQFDVAKVADRFIRTRAREGTQPSFKYLFLADDLKADPWRYVFATSFGNETTPYHVGIVSTARLDISDPKQRHHEGFEITAQRAYKLVLKSIARLAGLHSPDACVLAFPRSLEELDRKSFEFCPADRAALVTAGILKEKESQQGNDCLDIAHDAPTRIRSRTAQID
jgi:predicted Zn-dependent protease